MHPRRCYSANERVLSGAFLCAFWWIAPSANALPPESQGQTIDLPKTKEESRELLDRSEGRQFENFKDENSPAKIIEPLPPELLQIQQKLGGSVINQFPALRSDEAPPLQPYLSPPISVTVSPPAIAFDGRSAGCAVTALRAAAADLDAAANRLEQVELYSQADALRAQAQRLRKDARKLPSAPAVGQPSLAPAWQPGLVPQIAPEAPPQQPRRFGWEAPIPPTPAEPVEAQPLSEPKIGQRDDSDGDRG